MTDPTTLVTQADLVALTKELVAIPSVTNQEQAISDWMTSYFTRLGLRNVQRLAVPESGDTVVGEWGATAGATSGGQTLLLAFHMDTFAPFAGWEGDPFAPTVRDGRLCGLGAHDMKGGAACLLGAVAAVIQANVALNGRIIVAGTTDEENWSRGAHALIQSGRLADCTAALIPEPLDAGTLIVGARGRHVFQLTFHGKTVHAAFEGGVNALTAAAKVATLLDEPGQVDLGYLPEFDLAGTLVPIGLQSGGTMILVPERAELYIDRHILPGQTVTEAAEQIRTVVARAGIDCDYTLSWDARPTPAPTAYVVPTDSHLVRTVRTHWAREQEQPIRLTLARSVADTNHFAVHGGIPTLICGPQGGNTCEANEYVLVDSLLPVARTYIQTILDLLGTKS